ncbi:MAG: CGNR zinc finger domain-containing protein [Candidatus Thiodiazotropha sp. L084R]
MNETNSTFVFLGNNPAVDFVNTEVIMRGQRVDLLPTAEDLARWAESANLPLDLPVSQKSFTDALVLRNALSKIFSARIDGQQGTQQVLDTINRHLLRYTTHQVLTIKENKYVLVPDNSKLKVAMLLEYLAHTGATLLTSNQAKQLKRCSNPDCILLFVDTSRSRKRRWCSMETCGNRAKVSGHYQRQHS